MKKIKVDNKILQDKANNVIVGLQAYSEGFTRPHDKMSDEFKRQAFAMHALAGHIVGGLKPVKGATIIDVLNNANTTMLFKPTDEMDFGHEPMDGNHERFIELCEKSYEHAPAKGVFGKKDNLTIAKQAMRDYVEASIMFYTAVRAKQDTPYDADMVKRLADAANKIINFDIDSGPGNVIGFPPPKKS